MALNFPRKYWAFSLRPDVKRPALGLADVAVGLGLLALLYVVARVGAQSFVKFSPPDVIPSVSLDPRNLPNYAARSTLRMFVALGFSTLFTFVYGYAAARSRRAERVLVPLLDILQSVPVLGFLSVTVTAFIALFRGSLLGLEAASIFAIFTGQAWNMTFSFYQSLRSVPSELDEMATLYRLSAWERFTRLELPASVIGLVWNGMMSFGGGWFFLAASEAISVLNRQYTLPGIGSYVAAAIAARRSERARMGDLHDGRLDPGDRSALLEAAGDRGGPVQARTERGRGAAVLAGGPVAVRFLAPIRRALHPARRCAAGSSARPRDRGSSAVNAAVSHRGRARSGLQRRCSLPLPPGS